MTTSPPHYRLFLLGAPLVVVGLLPIALTDPFGQGVTDGVHWGLMCAQATAAAAWCAFGPGRLAWRLPASLVWIAGLPAMDAFARRHYLGAASHSVSVGIEVLGQWLLIQILLWVLASAWGVQLRHRDDANRDIDPRSRQFGIRQLMLATAAIGVALGVARIAVASLGFDLRAKAPFLLFGIVTNVIVTLPLLLASLLPKRALPLTALTLLLIGLVTPWEGLMYLGVTGYDAKGLYVWSNIFACSWMLAIALVVRLNGYRLATGR